MAERWLVELLEGFAGRPIDGTVIEAETKDEAVRRGAKDGDSRTFYRVTGPLPAGVGSVPPPSEYVRDPSSTLTEQEFEDLKDALPKPRADYLPD